MRFLGGQREVVGNGVPRRLRISGPGRGKNTNDAVG